ncbi:hypothetical protein TNCT_296301 [Trichonephila clavata]|uniref:Uncharacterized protein n=1 Tax=Trichonephila clavata TaxID=2740835 RepID=A0A8X6HTP1_TRICU|nr:hypothetical protein TNCT_296301 [Trichonephila clavata]
MSSSEPNKGADEQSNAEAGLNDRLTSKPEPQLRGVGRLERFQQAKKQVENLSSGPQSSFRRLTLNTSVTMVPEK